jgi:hypothetical protein
MVWLQVISIRIFTPHDLFPRASERLNTQDRNVTLAACAGHMVSFLTHSWKLVHLQVITISSSHPTTWF